MVEDAADGVNERALFHLINLVREEEAYLLITARTPPGRWAVALPDLASRLRAIPAVMLTAPDDALLRAVLVKLFADRQLAVDEALIAYLVTRIERSFAAARAAVERLDREALRRKRPVTRALAAEVLARRANHSVAASGRCGERRVGQRDSRAHSTARMPRNAPPRARGPTTSCRRRSRRCGPPSCCAATIGPRIANSARASRSGFRRPI